jgi:predicted  nucleic acid-binding Zn-ribbon protein
MRFSSEELKTEIAELEDSLKTLELEIKSKQKALNNIEKQIKTNEKNTDKEYEKLKAVPDGLSSLEDLKSEQKLCKIIFQILN